MTIKLLINLWSSFLVVATSFTKMIDLKSYKQLLEKNGISELSDEEVLRLRDHQDQLAEVFFALWVDAIKKQKSTV